MKNSQGLLPDMFYLFVNVKKVNFQIPYTGYKLQYQVITTTGEKIYNFAANKR